MESPKLESIKFKINIHFVIDLISFTQFHFIRISFSTLGFKQKQFIYPSINKSHKLVPKDNTRDTTKAIAAFSLIFLGQSYYVFGLSILVKQRKLSMGPSCLYSNSYSLVVYYLRDIQIFYLYVYIRAFQQMRRIA